MMAREGRNGQANKETTQMDIRVTFRPYTFDSDDAFEAETEGGNIEGLQEAYEAAQRAARGGDVMAASVSVWSPNRHAWVEVRWGADSGPEFFAALAEAASTARLDPEVLLAYADDFDEPDSKYAETPDAYVERIVDSYYGEFDDYAELGEYVLDEWGSLRDLPPGLEGYINFEAYGRDLCLGGDFTMTNSGHTFINH